MVAWKCRDHGMTAGCQFPMTRYRLTDLSHKAPVDADVDASFEQESVSRHRNIADTPDRP